MYKKLLKNIKKDKVFDDLAKAISHRPHSFQQPHVIFSAENPFHHQSLKMTHEEVVKLLKKKGYDVEEMTGKYGGKSERSILVKHPNLPKRHQHFHDLARKLGQDSLIISDGYNHEMHFLGPDKLGQHAKGTGTDWTDHEPDDNFSRLPNGKFFLHNFNHDQTHGGQSFLNAPKPEDKMEKSESPLMKAYKDHPLTHQHPNITLVHYSPTQGLKSIEPEHHGIRGIGEEAKQGAPEHKLSFYYLEGTKPESIVTTGSKSKYVTRLGDKKLYDISADKDNLFMQAQKLADQRPINPGAVRKEDFHHAIRSAGYHGIYNSSLENTMGRVVGMFEPMAVEQEHQMHPNDFQEVSAKNHHAEDAKTFKHPIHPNFYDWHDGHTEHHEVTEPKDVKKAEGAQKPMAQAGAVAPTNNQLQHPHLQAHGPTEPKNEQAGGVTEQSFKNVMQHYGTMQSGKQSNLKFYKGLEHHSEGIDKKLGEHGYQHYYAGGQFGKPDLAGKNYNTKHLMIYDPTPQSGGDFGDQKYTDAWRKSHELAHALTYPEVNSIYGEGRRLGKLGVRTPNEMKRAVHWEWLAAHKQRDLMKDLGYNMHDDDFHRELNTVMGDAVHRAVTGKFTEPSEMGFNPHSHKVPLEHALGAIDAHAKELGLEHPHDTLAEMNKRKGIAKAEKPTATKKPKLKIVPDAPAASGKAQQAPAAPTKKVSAPTKKIGAAPEPKAKRVITDKKPVKAPPVEGEEAPAKSNVQKEQEKVREQLENLKTDKQSTSGIFSRIYSIPSSDKMARSKTAMASGQVPSTVNVYGSHFPVVRMMNDNTLLLHTSPYGEEGKTTELVEKIKSELPSIFPEARVIEIHHPDYRHSAKIMRLRDPNSVHQYLEHASKGHPDENYRAHALEALNHLKGIKKGEFSKPIHAKRTASEGWDYKQNLENRMGRLHQYLGKLGLTPDMSDEHGRALGAGGPSNVGINLHGDPHDQQTLHEAAHAMLTPMGSSIKEYQESIGKPGFLGKLTQTQNAPALKATHGGGMPEATAQQMEAGIARRAGIEPFRSPQRGSKADSSVELGRAHAKKTLELYDEGIQSFDPFTGVNEPGSSVDAVINARARGDKGIFNKVHNAFKQRKIAEKANNLSHEDMDLAASEKDVSKPFGQHPRDWYKDQAAQKQRAKQKINGKKPLDAALDKLKETVKPTEEVKKAIEPLEKGSLQRRNPFNPHKQENQNITSKQRLWTHDEEQDHRDTLPKMEGSVRLRALNKLAGKTHVRKDPSTGERLFLMHRGMGLEEFKGSHSNGVTNYENGTKTSWTPDRDVAASFGSNAGFEGYPDSNIISAWIPESAVVHSINQFNAPTPESVASADKFNKPKGKDYTWENTKGPSGKVKIQKQKNRSVTEREESEWIIEHRQPFQHAHPDFIDRIGKDAKVATWTEPRDTNDDFKGQIGAKQFKATQQLPPEEKEQAYHNALNAKGKIGSDKPIPKPKKENKKLAASEKTQQAAIQPEHLDNELQAISFKNHPERKKYAKKYKFKKSEGKALKAGILGIAMASGAHHIGEENRKMAEPQSRTIASEGPKVDPQVSALQQVREQAQREGQEILRNNFVKQPNNKPSSIVVKETIKRDPELQEKYGFVSNLSHPAIKEVINTHPSLSYEVGIKHYDNLKNIFGEDHEKIADAYKNGVRATKQKYNMMGKQALKP